MSAVCAAPARAFAWLRIVCRVSAARPPTFRSARPCCHVIDPSSSSSSPLASRMWSLERAKAVLKTYGRAGAVTYLAVSSTVTAGFYVAIENHVDVGKWVGIKGERQKGVSVCVCAGAGGEGGKQGARS